MNDRDYINLSPLREGRNDRTRNEHRDAAMRMFAVLLGFVVIGILAWCLGLAA